MDLKEYQAKRDFARTKEPAGKVGRRRRQPVFVIQKHAATRLHYDFRLEMEGVLKSWAVPKGFPVRRGERRLAIEVEDHPLEYGQFEGTIPEGNYGAGTVMVWDRGTYEVIGDEPVSELRKGKLHLVLKGQRLKGEWALVRLRASDDAKKPQWLLLKTGGDITPISRTAENRSVLTGRSLEQIAGAEDKIECESNRSARRSKRVKERGHSCPHQCVTRQDSSNFGPRWRSEVAADRNVRAPPASAQLKLARLPKAKPDFVAPMKAVLAGALPKGAEWIYEIKFDGVRALAIKDERSLTLVSRNGKVLGFKYPSIVEALRALPAKGAVLDGEVVAVDDEGRPWFQLLQCYESAGPKKPPLCYYVFDVLNLDGKDLTGLPLEQRKAMAQALVAGLPPAIRFSASIQAEPDRLVRELRARGLEGVVAKKKGSKYEPGRRSTAWVKFKWANEQEFVIGGYTQPKGARRHFGAILVGYNRGSQLLFAAKVGTGFDDKLLATLHGKFQKLVRPDCPFANLPEPRGSRSNGLMASQMRMCTWLEPRLVCQVRFGEWTRDGHLRQPVFLGLREDKEPREVVREGAASVER